MAGLKDMTAALKASNGSTDRRAGRILFVDDDPFYRDMAHAAMDEAGFSVDLAEDGETALRAMQGATYDLIVLDLSMPGISGFDVIAEMCGTDGRPHTPTLVITGHDDTSSVERAFDAGATSFLAKPLNWVLFVHHVKFLLKAVRTEANYSNASRMAELMGDFKQRLVGTLVNEVQGPLRSAFGFATLMKQEADGPVSSPLYAAWIGEIHKALDKIMATQTRLLDFDKTLPQGMTLTEQTFSLTRVIGELLSEADELAQRRAIRLERSGLDRLRIQYTADPALLLQALRVPLSNAMRLSARGSAVKFSIDELSSGDLVVRIVDTTPAAAASGIADVVMKSTTPKAGTTTLEQSSALKLCASIVEAHGGTFKVVPFEGDGLTTEIILPGRRNPALAGDAAPASASGENTQATVVLAPQREVPVFAQATVTPAPSAGPLHRRAVQSGLRALS